MVLLPTSGGLTTPGRSVDLNADLGEGFGRWNLGTDERLLAIVTSANIACGFHAGDPTIMRRVCAQAMEHGVRIGAQVGYRDLVGFGRRRIEIAPGDLTADVLYQLGALQAFAQAAGAQVSYLKPHGALYNTAVTDPVQAGAIVDAVQSFDPSLPILTLPGSQLASQAQARGMVWIGEGFADRAYLPDATLLARDQPNAVLHEPDEIAARAVVMVAERRVRAVDGTDVALALRSLCVHGDTPGAVEIATSVRAALLAAGITLASFTG